MKKLLIVFAILACAVSAFAGDLQVSSTGTIPSTVTSCNFQGLPASITATNAPVTNGACMADIQSLLGPSASYSVTYTYCVPVTGTGIPAGTQACGVPSPPLAFTLPAVTAPSAAATAPGLVVH